jgi:hypothetical protein
MACSRPGRVTWEAIVAGVFSSFFSALYPVLLLRTHRTLLSSQLPRSDTLGNERSSAALENPYAAQPSDDYSGSKEESRAYWLLLHYTSLLSLILLTPLVLLSRELPNMRRNCYFLDVPFFWFLIFCSSLGAWAVFWATPLLIRATSPVSAVVLGAPRGAFQLAVLSGWKMPVHSWIGVSFCWMASLWYAGVRRWEERVLERLRLEGR